MKTKITCLLLVLVMVVGMLASCGGDTDTTCTEHVDANKDKKCDVCGEAVTGDDTGKNPTCPPHVDSNEDNRCDKCKKIIKNDTDEGEGEEEIINYPWESADLTFQMTKQTGGNTLLAGCYRYLAGEDFLHNEKIDSQISDRNRDAYEKTKVNVSYKYYDDVAEYGWGACIEVIFTTIKTNSSKSAPDMYCNFTYDLVGVSLKGGFANLKTVQHGDNYFEFNDPDYNEEVDNRGYMWDYMQSTTLSKEKVYILASDYFIDLVRAFYIVPVHVGLLEEGDIGMKLTGDLDGDGVFTLNDFYEEVKLKKWNYDKVADYSREVYKSSDGATETLKDRIGFAVSQLGIAPNGLLFTTSITIINRTENADGTTTYNFPTDSPSLYDMVKNLEDLMKETGVIAVSGSETYNFGTSPVLAIRNRFCQGQVLFGDVMLVGGLEMDAYQELKGGEGFGVVPVPLYHEVSLESDENYLTAIHNTGNPGAIAYNTNKFSECSAFLNYQSTHSTDILNYYYDFKLQYDITDGAQGTVEMLQYIRKNVRSAFDKTMEDAIGVFHNTQGDRWSQILELAPEFVVDMRYEYGQLVGVKQERLEALIKSYATLPG